MFARASSSIDDAGIDAASVAVMPFRVSGDESVDWLEDGMADLLAAALTGEGGLRAADPRRVHRALQRTGAHPSALPEDMARALAARIGAGNVLLGEVVGTADRVLINARLVDVHGRRLARARVEGPTTEVATLVDALTAQLLSLGAREAPHRLASLTSTSLPALRAYLEGQSLYRRGRHEEALVHYAHAMELDTTFALAALAAELTAGWFGTDAGARARTREIAWRHRDRLSGADRAVLAAALGPDYPEPSSARASIDAVEEGLRLAPDRVELWYMQGDAWLHQGRVLGGTDWEDRAIAAFERALSLDSAFAPAMHHLVLLHARRRDLPRLDAASGMLLRHEPDGPTAHFAHWLRSAPRGAARASAACRHRERSVRHLPRVARVRAEQRTTC
jgi:tetratricopeptide (TPR) repeat protein